MDPLVPLLHILANNNSGTKNIVPYIITIFIFILFSAYFSMAETTLSCCNRIRMSVKAENGSKSAKLVIKLLDKFDKSLITLLVGNNIANLAASTLGTLVFLVVFNYNESLASAISTAVLTILIFFFGELIPKNIAKSHPDSVVMIMCYPLIVLYYLFYPVTIIFYGITRLVQKIFKADQVDNNITEDEFQAIVEAVEKEGGIDEEESDIIQAAVDFGDITVSNVLTPIEKVFALDIKNTSRKELITHLKNTEFSRIPVYDGEKNNIIGILHVRKFLKNYMKTKNGSARAAISEPPTVNASYKLDDMIDFFKDNKKHMAVVKNDDNVTIGIVTMEDVLEELIGEQDLNLKQGGSK